MLIVSGPVGSGKVRHLICVYVCPKVRNAQRGQVVYLASMILPTVCKNCALYMGIYIILGDGQCLVVVLASRLACKKENR